MHGQYRSRLTPFYSSEDISFDLRLMQQEKVQDISEIDIQVIVFTSQLSPRKSVYSIVSNPESQPTVEGANIVRYDDHFILNLRPEFLADFPTGVLTLSIRYKMNLSLITNVITTEKFLNDSPSNTDLLTY